MKTAVSIPDDVFSNADRAAGQLGLSRSRLYTRALQEFLERRGEDPVTAALDALADEFDEPLTRAGRSLIDSGGWEW